MISFNLKCEHEHEFEGWFKDSAAFAKQAEQQLLECPLCGTNKVSKALSAPNISTSRSQAKAQSEMAVRAHQMIAEMRKTVEENCDNVGDKFAEEARKIHYGETEARGIYGQATADEAKELIEEGVDFTPMPWLDEKAKN
ncbi:DUF1178 family protein [Aestuariispira insulae]|uniref:DUF1178 family protein n=1 Tax=Aestuariispira insulae TaxID=1461337 RepID=A0A3D9HDV6_9PROT|nr:DUF1178 family protein [Aestuariispira insulae]RED47655.1 hypothetical protein DFP90_10919 [Aestuariispira insulae]